MVKASTRIRSKNVFHTKMMNDYFSSAKQLEIGTLEEIHNMTIYYFFLHKFQNIIDIEHQLKEHQGDLEYLGICKQLRI